MLEFIDEFEKQASEIFTDKKMRDLVLNNLVSFGPNRYGPNLLIMSHVNKEECILEKLRNRANKSANSKNNSTASTVDSTSVEESATKTTAPEKVLSAIFEKLNGFKK